MLSPSILPATIKPPFHYTPKTQRYLCILTFLLAGMTFLAGSILAMVTKEILYGLLCVLGGVLFAAALLIHRRLLAKTLSLQKVA
ncbi:hypothetical protein [Chlamydia pecorum]|uniref:Membrane protein n=1 Tax=Chlamydia pecorum TaxID=85991 RepID=A0AA40U5A6_9CHLA|nr:hypothetical protein [Chlamydia pecorum]KTF28645.1 putative membrane protein [Chlamydia pecorum]KZN26668.1 putative membrane protein [Chlamydia pecorum]KZN26939.1 putative membrane protein [Chlamydia pecorum]